MHTRTNILTQPLTNDNTKSKIWLVMELIRIPFSITQKLDMDIRVCLFVCLFIVFVLLFVTTQQIS